MIIKDISKLKTKCEPVSSIEEGEELGAQLLKELTESKNGIGLAANQIGINKRVCVVNVMEEPLILINPEIVKLDGETYSREGCLSFPGSSARTKRFKYVTIKSDNYGTVMFGPTGNISNDVSEYTEKQQLQLLESVCVQHEIDHLDGITMFDRQYIQQPIERSTKKIGRNDKVTLKKGDIEKVIKWKKAESLLSDGWELINI